MIQVLDTLTANGIAAGEVIERPASVVKELIENSLDAGASIIHCRIEQGGIKKIVITDNGIGMTKEDAQIAFQRHATSKLHKLSDLDSLTTMGFRGEALASIAAVSNICLRTRQIGSDEGFEIRLSAGRIIQSGKVGCPEGTQIEITDLFHNVPARYKFLKKDSAEQGFISDLITRLALSRSDVSFRLSTNGKDLIYTPGNNDLLSTIYVLWGKEVAESMLSVNYQHEQIKVQGYLSTPQVARGNRSRQIIFVNKRNIVSKVISSAIFEAGKTWFMKGKFPSLVLNLEIPTSLVDINVHPQKTEVRFWNEQIVFRAIYHALRDAWEGDSTVIKGEIISKSEHTQTPVMIIDDKLDQSGFPENKQPVPERQQTLAESGLLSDDAGRSELQHQDYQGLVENKVSPHEQAEVFLHNYKIEEQKPDQNQMSKSIKPVKHSELEYLLKARLIGQVFQTYLLLEYEDKFILIDQHAAHERILYEELHEKYLKEKSQPAFKQTLLQPIPVEVTNQEMALLEEHRDEICRLGFELDVFGGDTILIRTVPDTKSGKMNAVNAVKAIIDSLLDRSFWEQDKQDELLYTVACKAAIKAHDNLSYTEMKEIIRQLLTLNNPFHCPHGRPLMVELSRNDLEKLFRRII